GYPVDVFANGFESAHVRHVMSAHTHVISTGLPGDLPQAIHRALNEVMGVKAEEVRLSMQADRASLGAEMPEAESAILWLRHNLPEGAETILARARNYYMALSA